jgi:hypothetical protein
MLPSTNFVRGRGEAMRTPPRKRYQVLVVGAPAGQDLAMDFDARGDARNYWAGERTLNGKPRRLQVLDSATGEIIYPPAGPDDPA